MSNTNNQYTYKLEYKSILFHPHSKEISDTYCAVDRKSIEMR